MLWSRGKECLKKLPCQISVIAFTGNKFWSNNLLCQKKLEEGSDETVAWNLCAFKLRTQRPCKITYSCSLSLKMQDARNKQKKQKTSKKSAVRFRQKFLLLFSRVDTFQLAYHSLRFIVFVDDSFAVKVFEIIFLENWYKVEVWCELILDKISL